jgi:ABC-type transport system involved in cytochrome bd biosynthesis fused ATPase/permease subunit
VSSLKKSPFGTSGGDDETGNGLGIENGSFKWNEVEQNEDNEDQNGQNERADKKAKDAISTADDAAQDASDGTERSSIAAKDDSEHRFELRDINITFPERQLTVVTGPTASGKTALLVSICFG